MYYFLYTHINIGKFRKLLINMILKAENGYPYSKTIRKIFSTYHNIHIGYGTYGGCFNTSNIPANVSFGNYCSIAKNIKIFRANHPLNEFTLHPILYNPIMGYVKQDMLKRPPLVIGHDVWIGEDAIILPNVNKIGNGAVIGAGSIVTKDVEPYSVVVGNPAKKIKTRFSDDIVRKLEDSQWWNLELKVLVTKIDELKKITNESV